MDELFVIFLIAVTLIFILPIWALVSASKARRRVDELEARIAWLEEGRAERPASPASGSVIPQVRSTPSMAEKTALDTARIEAETPAPREVSETPSKLATATPDGVSRARTSPEFQGPPAPRQPGLAERLGPWLRENWIYPAAAAFLMLAGIFLVQYSIEAGLLSQQLRVTLAAILGLALMAAGEWIRRRAAMSQAFGAFSAHLPSTFVGAGVVVVYGAIYAAHVLYDLIPAVLAFGAMALVTLVAIGFGWVYGPLLAALGVLAGTATPFLLGEGGTPPPWIFGYFGIVLALGLGIDALRRWQWISRLALIAPLGAATLMRMAGGDETAYAILLVLASALAMTLPGGALRPVARGRGIFTTGRSMPDHPVFISALSVGIATLGLVVLVQGWAGAIGLVALVLLLAVWADKAPALANQVLAPAVGLIAWAVLQEVERGPIFNWFTRVLPPESSMPLEASMVLGLAVIGALALFFRSDREEDALAASLWAVGGLALPGSVMIALELFWAPAGVIGAYPWALHALALAALNTAQALHYARVDAGQGLRLGAAAASAFALIGFGLMLVLSLAALTVALAILMVASALMDRRFNLPALGVFQVLASVALAYRFVVDPGIFWIIEDLRHDAATLPEVLLTLIAVIGGPMAALYILRGAAPSELRRKTALFIETGLIGMIAVAVPVVILRLLPFDLNDHASLGLHATVFIALAKVQQMRLEKLEDAKRLRKFLMYSYGLVASVAIGLSITLVTPLGGLWSTHVQGPVIVNDLMVAYAFPAIAILALFNKNIWLRHISVALLAYWLALVIRHFWQGGTQMALWRGMSEPELYTYTVAILLAGASALMRALQTGQSEWRKIGMGLIALATLKAFLIDASGLAGLLRVFGFLAMGLALAGLAWVNRWVMAKEQAPKSAPDSETP